MKRHIYYTLSLVLLLTLMLGQGTARGKGQRLGLGHAEANPREGLRQHRKPPACRCDRVPQQGAVG